MMMMMPTAITAAAYQEVVPISHMHVSEEMFYHHFRSLLRDNNSLFFSVSLMSTS
jgi:hypothetical protein